MPTVYMYTYSPTAYIYMYRPTVYVYMYRPTVHIFMYIYMPTVYMYMYRPTVYMYTYRATVSIGDSKTRTSCSKCNSHVCSMHSDIACKNCSSVNNGGEGIEDEAM